MIRLNGCFAKDGQELDGREFEVATLREFVELLKNNKNKQMHLNYFDNEDDLDIWLN
jgi:hypothetical protein